jgi:hypothetical protein
MMGVLAPPIRLLNSRIYVCWPFISLSLSSGATVAAAEITFAIVYGCGDLVACIIIIHFDRLVLIKKVLVNDEPKPINLKNLICFSVLIQRQHEGWTRSSTFRQVNTNRRGFPSFEKFLKVLSYRMCNFKHTLLLFRILFPVGFRLNFFLRKINTEFISKMHANPPCWC